MQDNTCIANKLKNASQIEFCDTEELVTYKSLYLDTLGEAARRSPSPIDRHHQQHGTQRASSTSYEGYVHGTLSTTGIHGASPTIHNLSKQQQKAVSDLAAAGVNAAAAEVFRPNVLGQVYDDDDPGMRPKVLIPASTNRPDLTHTTADIQGAQPHPKDVCHRPRDTNPLCPQYRLATGSFHMPSGPAPADKLLRDTLNITDIPGAVPRPKTPAARAAAARAAAMASVGGCMGSRGSSSPRVHMHASKRPGVLEVSDIEGATATWHQVHRQHANVSTRDTCLNVSDITSFMARFKPAPRNSAEYKGHPQGPRAPPHIRPRSDPAIMDNSLRLLDIAGTSVHLAPRATHSTCLHVTDIEGAHAKARDRAKLFAEKKVLSAAATAKQEVAQSVLSALQLSQQELLVLWNECSRLDRGRSGFLTGQEMAAAIHHAQLQLSTTATQHLVAALEDNAGLLNYKRLTRQLKQGCCGTRPASAAAAVVCGGTDSPGVTPLQSRTQPEAPGMQPQRPQSALPRPRLQEDYNPAAAGLQSSGSRETSSSSRACCRPSTAPARPCGASASHHHGAGESARSRGRSSRVGVSSVSHWFAGSSRDVAPETLQWRPSSAHGSSRGGGDSRGGWQSALAATTTSAAEECTAVDGGCCGESPDVLPAWLVGADAVHGTCSVVQPFGLVMSSPPAAGALKRPASAGPRSMQPAVARNVGRSSDRLCVDSSSIGRERPSSAAVVGLAERKRLMETDLQDLMAVRMLK